ncbi:MAG: HAMP domain-containing histidine kinase [Actinomycetes bacterium]|jgi:signal transduction histidine kinase|nr:HAMP domain-containing histidine kinase [Actinomycetes bacterium]
MRSVAHGGSALPLRAAEMSDRDRILSAPRSRGSVFAFRIGIAFALVAAMTAILAGLITWVAWTLQFNQYVRSNLQDTADGVAVAAAEAYQVYGGWNMGAYSVIPRVGSRTDVIVQIVDTTGTIIYDVTPEDLRAQIFDGNAPTLSDDDATMILDSDNRNVMSAPVIVSDALVGEVRVWAYGPNGLLTSHDLQMRLYSLIALAVAGFVAIIVATAAGVTYARRFVRPIRAITATAQALRQGEEGARTGLAGDDEIAQLGVTFDRMADSIHADRLLERRLTSDVAHELRTPLMGIQATVEAIEDGIYPADEAHLSVISSETRRLARLTNAILELSRLENATERFVLRRVDVAVPVRASIDAHLALLESCSLHLDVQLSEGLFLLVDTDKLQQALGNFLSNAARYTPEGGTVSVKAFAGAGDDAGACLIQIADSGIGISDEDQARLFSRFWRADAARSRASGGIGVGLAIAKEIIERHHGSITVASQVGAGTTFTIYLPLAEG